MSLNLIHDRHVRGHTKIGWLDSYHTFSFGGFYDPNRMGFRSLRVINDDRVIPGAGFGTHSHQDMEIITYVIEGASEHKDSLGNGTVIYPGDAQIMSAGTSITHSEFNHSKSEPVHFLQIWIIPDRQNLEPPIRTKTFSLGNKTGQTAITGRSSRARRCSYDSSRCSGLCSHSRCGRNNKLRSRKRSLWLVTSSAGYGAVESRRTSRRRWGSDA